MTWFDIADSTVRRSPDLAKLVHVTQAAEIFADKDTIAMIDATLWLRGGTGRFKPETSRENNLAYALLKFGVPEQIGPPEYEMTEGGWRKRIGQIDVCTGS